MCPASRVSCAVASARVPAAGLLTSRYVACPGSVIDAVLRACDPCVCLSERRAAARRAGPQPDPPLRSNHRGRVRIGAEPRTEFGKGGARRTRRAGRVPAVLYGHGQAPCTCRCRPASSLPPSGTAARTVCSPSSLDGKDQLALPKAVQRDPIKGTLEHVDLLIVRRGEKVTVEVPVHLIGEAAPDTLVITEHDHARRRGRGHAHPDRRRGLASRAWRPARRSPPATSRCPRARRWSPTRSCVVVTSRRRRPPRQLEAEPAEAEAEAGVEAAEAADGSRPTTSRRGQVDGRRESERADAVSEADPHRRHRRPGWSSAWATPGPGTPATGTTSGFMVARRAGRPGRRPVQGAQGARADVLEGRLGLGGPRVVLAKPLSYMNESGGPVAALAHFYKVPPERIVVVHDELDIPYGALRLKPAAARRPQRAAVDSHVARHARTTCGSVSASAARPAGRTRPTSC